VLHELQVVRPQKQSFMPMHVHNPIHRPLAPFASSSRFT
jgi:hypothetical protein